MEEMCPRDRPHWREVYNISKRMSDILFAIVVTVVGAFAVKGIEMGVINAKESLKSEISYKG